MSRSVVIAAWHCLLEDAAGCQAGGSFRIDAEGIAAVLIEQPEVIDKVMKAFADVALIVDGIIDKWSKRQYESDSSTERSRKFREKQKTKTAPPRAPPKKQDAVDATFQGRSATPPDTETDTESEEKKKRMAPGGAVRAEIIEAAFEAAWKQYPKRQGGNSRADALKAFTARCRSGESPSALIAGTARYASFIRAKGDEGTEFVKQGATFYGPGKHYAEQWDFKPTARPGGRAGDVQGTEDHNASVVEQVRRDRAQQHTGVTV